MYRSHAQTGVARRAVSIVIALCVALSPLEALIPDSHDMDAGVPCEAAMASAGVRELRAQSEDIARHTQQDAITKVGDREDATRLPLNGRAPEVPEHAVHVDHCSHCHTLAAARVDGGFTAVRCAQQRAEHRSPELFSVEFAPRLRPPIA